MLSGSILAKDAYVFHPGISAEDYNIEDQQIDTPFIKLQPTGQTDRNGNRKREGERKRERERPIKREREAEVGEAERARGIEYRAQNVLFHDSFGLIQDQNVADLAGDALFICMDCLQNQKSFIDHNYTLLLGLLGRITPAFLAQQGLCDHK